MTLTTDQNKIVKRLIAAGRFGAEEELISAALGLLAESVEDDAGQLGRLRCAVQVGLEQADGGQFEDFTAESILRERNLRH